MSYVIAAPEMMTAAASDLAAIGSNVSAAHIAAAAPTVAVMPAAADEVSASIAALFSEQGQLWQTLSADAQVLHQQFVAALQAAALDYQEAEAYAARVLDTIRNAPVTPAVPPPVTGPHPPAPMETGTGTITPPPPVFPPVINPG